MARAVFLLACLARVGHATADSEMTGLGNAMGKAFVPTRMLPKPSSLRGPQLERKITQLEAENEELKVVLEHVQSRIEEKANAEKSSVKFSVGVLGLGVGGVLLYSLVNKLAAEKNSIVQRTPEVQMAFDPEVYPGVQAPTGFWDPLGLSTDVTEEKFLRWRATELKHGRVSMVACLGYIVPYWFRWPGTIDVGGTKPFTDIPVGIAALKSVPDLGWLQIVALCGLLEIGPFRQIAPEFPGDAGWDPLNLAPEAPDQLLAKKNAELANGRLAMLAIMGFLVQDVINNGNPYAPFYDPDDVGL